jgi:DNA-binding transcriptional ArsR family regulator
MGDLSMEKVALGSPLSKLDTTIKHEEYTVEREPMELRGEHFQTVAFLAKSLSDENRLRILLCVSNGKKSVSSIVEELALSQPLVSHHLKELKREGGNCKQSEPHESIIRDIFIVIPPEGWNPGSPRAQKKHGFTPPWESRDVRLLLEAQGFVVRKTR